MRTGALWGRLPTLPTCGPIVNRPSLRRFFNRRAGYHPAPQPNLGFSAVYWVYSIEGTADRLSDPRLVLYFGGFRVMRILTVIATAIAIVTVSVMTSIRCLLSVQT
jgi:hypothetical protein